MEQIHERLKAELSNLGITAAAAARAAGMTDSQGLRDTLNGRKRVTADLLALLIPLGVDPLRVLTGQSASAVAAPSTLDAELLADAIKVVEQLLAKTGRTFTPAKKAKHVVALYQAFSSGSDADASAVTEALTRAA